jgi:hypothetical protein
MKTLQLLPVIDPMGTNAAMTVQRCGFGGGRAAKFLDQSWREWSPRTSIRWRPIDSHSAQLSEEIHLVVDALMIQEHEGEVSH